MVFDRLHNVAWSSLHTLNCEGSTEWENKACQFMGREFGYEIVGCCPVLLRSAFRQADNWHTHSIALAGDCVDSVKL